MSIAKLFSWSRPQKKHVYEFSDGSADDKQLLGLKGSNLCEMFRFGMPVPAGFILSTETCTEFINSRENERVEPVLSEQITEEYEKAIHNMEKQSGKYFGGNVRPQSKEASDGLPLLLSIRSSSLVEIPGIAKSILNLGMNEEVVKQMESMSNNPRWAYDCYRRFLHMFGTNVLNVENYKYEDILKHVKAVRGIRHDSLLTLMDLQKIIKEYKQLAEYPSDPWDQLRMAIESVFHSWYSPNAMKYRDLHNIVTTTSTNDLQGTAVIVQSMVYGNMNSRSGSGIAHTRNPSTGEKGVFGLFLANAAGEEVMQGNRTPVSLQDMHREHPHVYETLVNVMVTIEKHYKNMQDIEFTVENGNVFLLETSMGKRTSRAAVRIAASMVKEKLITEREAIMRLDPLHMDYFLYDRINPSYDPDCRDPHNRIIGHGHGLCGGAVSGKLVFTNEQAIQCREKSERCILCRIEFSNNDIMGIQACNAIISLSDNTNPHLVRTLKGLGKSGVSTIQDMSFDKMKQQLCSKRQKDVSLDVYTMITIDGVSGIIYNGHDIPLISNYNDESFQSILHWADKYKHMEVYCNIYTKEESSMADSLGAEGIGLCRTESMFFHKTCIDLFRHVLLSNTPTERTFLLNKMQLYHEQFFVDIFKYMYNRNITIRLLDCPLSYFFPNPIITSTLLHSSSNYEQDVQHIAKQCNLEYETVLNDIHEIQEQNPLLGLRGSRLSILYHEITEMQTRAIINAALEVRQRDGIVIRPHILIPLICSDHEVNAITPIIRQTCVSTLTEAGHSENYIDWSIGVSMETPRACLRADRISNCKDISFLSFDTKDLTQMVFGFGKADCMKYMNTYMEQEVMSKDPFVEIDIRGVGSLMNLAVKKWKKHNPKLPVGVVGDHCYDLTSIMFFDKIGINYISCPLYRIPVAKVAAAQANIESTSGEEAFGDEWYMGKILMSSKK